MDTPNVLSELELLNLNRPVLGDTDAVIAAWYRQKAVVLGHLKLDEYAALASAHADPLDSDARLAARARVALGYYNKLIGAEPGGES
jgi:hypothetical protein